MKLCLILFSCFYFSFAYTCEPALPDPDLNKDWVTIHQYQNSKLVIKAKVIQNTDTKSLFNSFNRSIGNEYINLTVSEYYKGKSKKNITIILRDRWCGYADFINIGEERLFYVNKRSDEDYVSRLALKIV